MPDVDYKQFVQNLLTVETQMDFQIKVMGPFLEMLVAKTTHGLSIDGLDNYDPSQSYTFITNHRDIVLDASFLNLCFIRAGLPLTQVAIGNNLLIFDWITDLVKLNRSFIVKRDGRVREALDNARHLSAYIHYAVGEMHESNTEQVVALGLFIFRVATFEQELAHFEIIATPLKTSARHSAANQCSMRLALVLILPMLLVGLLVDWYIVRAVWRRCPAVRRFWRPFALWSSVLCQIGAVVAVCWPKRAGGDGELLALMWILYSYLSV